MILLLIIILLLRRKKKPQREEDDVKLTENILHFDVRSEDGERMVKAEIHEKLVVGRSASCDISLMDKLMSRQHFMIEKDSGSFYISDMNTTNGTLVNGVKIISRCKLKNGDVIQAGSLHITISW